MTKSYTRYRTRIVTDPAIKIKGRLIDLYTARILYRCEECLGKLRRRNAGLVCIEDGSHRGFIHRDEAIKIATEQAAELEQIEAVYEIVDGQLVAKEK